MTSIGYRKYSLTDFWDSRTTDGMTYPKTSAMARWVFSTTAKALWVRFYTTMYTAYPASAGIEVRVSGMHNTTLMAARQGWNWGQVTGLAAGDKVIEIIAGGQSAPSDGAEANVIGTWPAYIQLVNGYSVSFVAPFTPEKKVVVYGDSIAVGGHATNPWYEGWPALLRSYYNGGTNLQLEAWGYRQLYNDCSTDGSTDSFATTLSGMFTGVTNKRLWLAIGTNDYGLAPWTAANFGTKYARLLDQVHATDSAISIYCMAPTPRTDTGANAQGSTFANYISQISSAAGSRTGWCTYVDTSSWITPASDCDDGLHPTTSGHNKIYTQVKSLIG